MLVQPAYSRIAEQNAATPVRLQSVFVRINYERIRFSDPGKGSARIFPKILREHEISSVSRISMNPESMLCAQGVNLRQGIH